MSVTQVGAVYATVSKLLQRVYIPHGDDSEIDKQPVADGETLVKVPIETYRSGGPPAVQELIGKPTFSGRCVLVDQKTGAVVDAIVADPAIYAHPDGHAVIPNDYAIPGDLWDEKNEIFTRRYVEIDPKATDISASIVSVSIQDIDKAAPAAFGNILMPSVTLNVGDPIAATLYTKIKSKAG